MGNTSAPASPTPSRAGMFFHRLETRIHNHLPVPGCSSLVLVRLVQPPRSAASLSPVSSPAYGRQKTTYDPCALMRKVEDLLSIRQKPLGKLRSCRRPLLLSLIFSLFILSS